MLENIVNEVDEGKIPVRDKTVKDLMSLDLAIQKRQRKASKRLKGQINTVIDSKIETRKLLEVQK